MQLSKNFTLDEFTFSQTASRSNIDNTPSPEVLEKLKYTAECMEKVRKILSYPVHISSGYRNALVNKAVGGAKNSQHLTGEAVDFTCPKFGTPRQIVEKLLEYDLPFTQLILEYDRWVHISFSSIATPKKEVLVINSEGTRVFS